jgi:hypothetical protein
MRNSGISTIAEDFAPNDLPKVEVHGEKRDLMETKEIEPKTRIKNAGIEDIRLFSMRKEHDKYLTPAEAVIARGVKITIKDLKDYDPDELKAN